MNRKITVLSGTYVLFLLLLFVSGCVQGVISEIVYFSAFLLPLAFGRQRLYGARSVYAG